MADNKNIIEKPEEASKGGFQAIKEFQGDFEEYERVDNIFGATDDNGKARPDQIKMGFSDVVITEMEQGEEEPDLTDGKYTIHVNYAKPGKDAAHKNSFWVKGVLESTKAMGTTPSQLVGKRVTLRHTKVALFTRKDKDTNEEEIIEGSGYIFTTGEAQAVDMDALIAKEILGKNKQLALRSIMQNARLKGNKELVANIQAGAPVAGLELVDNVYAETKKEG